VHRPEQVLQIGIALDRGQTLIRKQRPPGIWWDNVLCDTEPQATATGIQRITRERWTAAFPPVQATRFQLPHAYLVSAGTSQWQLNGRVLHMQPGSFCLVRAEDHCRHAGGLTGPLDLWLLSVHGDPASGRLLRQLRGISHLHLDHYHRVAVDWAALQAEARQAGPLLGERVLARLDSLLLGIRHAAALRHQGRNQAFRHYQECRTRIDAQAEQALSPADVARQAGIGVAYLGRLFRRYAGCTPSRYISTVQMRAAAERLRQQQEPLEAIAEDLGFASPAAFSRAFKRVVGLAPADYRSGG